jgi:hypothetical protein
VDDEAMAEWRKTAENTYSRIRGSLVPPEIFDEVQRLRDEFQSKNRP